MHTARLLAVALLLIAAGAVPSSPQGLPGTQAYIQGQAGWAALREGRHQDAAEAFEAAVVTEPRDPSLHMGAGIAASLLGRTGDAQASIERALALSPPFTAASLLLGDLLHRDNQLEAAARVYEAALTYAPTDATLVDRLARVREESALHSQFFQSQGAHFTVLFEGPADEALARRCLEVLEAAYWRVATTLVVFPERLIPVILYTEQQFRDVTRSPEWAAAAYDGRIKVPVRGALENPDELDRVLTHEFTHALVQSIAPRGVPTWLNEGLAVFFEPHGEAWADAQLADSGARLSLQRLTRGFDRLSGTEARMAYAQSGGIVRALMALAGPQSMTGLLQDLGRGDPFDEAFERRMALSFANFASSLASAP